MTFSLKVSLDSRPGYFCGECLRVHPIAVSAVLKDKTTGVRHYPALTCFDS
jgi:hypothetical protein